MVGVTRASLPARALARPAAARPAAAARRAVGPRPAAPPRGPSPPCSLNNVKTTGSAPPTARARRTTDAPRLAIPSKGRMAEDTLQLLRDCQLNVYKPNPRQYVATIPALPAVEVWFQRASDVVRKLAYGDVDLGIVG